MKSKTYLCGILVACLVMMVACSDDESFTTSTQSMLTFSRDTVSLDTVFSRIPTPTKDLWVYNRSGDGLRLTSVKLASGNQTGFRVNVDGTYLSEVSGFQVQHLELRNKDSIRVFVELTSPTNGSLEPQVIEDDLVFTLESGTQQRVNIRAWTWDADIISNLRVSEDLTLRSERPIVIYGKIVVDSLATLTIPEGQTIYFHAGAGIDVYGTLRCLGSPGKNVILRGDRIDNMFDYLPYDLVSGQWQGIRFHESSYDNVLQYTDIHSTFDGVLCDSASIERTKLTMNGSIIHNCQGVGLQVKHCLVDIVNSQVTNTLGPCVDLLGGNVLIQHCTLAQFYPFDAARGPALQFTNAPDTPMLLTCLNSLVTGYAEDVIMGNQTDTVSAFDYRFESSILRTPAGEDTLRFKDILWEDPEDTITTAEKHFKLVDIHKQHYDFHLDSLSTAIGRANPLYALPEDRDGKTRDEKPDIGCYEYKP